MSRALCLWFAKTSAETNNETVLGREGLNTHSRRLWRSSPPGDAATNISRAPRWITAALSSNTGRFSERIPSFLSRRLGFVLLDRRRSSFGMFIVARSLRVARPKNASIDPLSRVPFGLATATGRAPRLPHQQTKGSATDRLDLNHRVTQRLHKSGARVRQDFLARTTVCTKECIA